MKWNGADWWNWGKNGGVVKKVAKKFGHVEKRL